MQKPPLQQLIDTKFDKLPTEVSSLFHSEENANIIGSIAQKNKLSEEQEMFLFDEIAYVFFGITSISNFKNEIKNTLSIDEKTALSISSEVYGSVFLPIKRFLIETPNDGLSGIYSTSETKNTTNLGTETINHQDILNEIENPTPSIYPKINQNPLDTQSNSTVLDIDALELTGTSITKNTDSGSEIVSKTNTPVVKSIDPVVDSVPVLSGFKPISNETHPAQTTADKLNSVLENPTKTTIKEIYQSKKPDPYHEPLE